MPIQYSPGLVTLSIVVAILVSFTSLRLASRVADSRHLSGRVWLILGAISMGLGIWSMHFIGMLALSLPIELHYDIGLTLLSLLAAIVTSAFAIKIASGSSLQLLRHLICSVVMGLGIVTMHYTGMAAIPITPAISYDPELVAASVLIAVSASFVALWLTFKLRSETHRHVWLARLGASVVMGLAITGMHYTGMAASHFLPGSICRGGLVFDDRWLAVSVAITTLALLTITLMTVVFDAHLESRVRLHAQRLERANRRLSHQASHDALTGLPNRSLFASRLREAIEAAKTTNSLIAVMFIDLDRFKAINDSLGHAQGDAVLTEAAKRLLTLTGPEALAGRVGGDEFLLFTRVAATADAIEAARRVIQSLSQVFDVTGLELHLAASVGITTYPFDDSVADILISHADEAMYEVKRAGGNGFRFFLPGTTLFTKERLQLEADLRHAAERGQLELHYQPQVDIQSGRIIGLEALARWRHPELGWIPPGEFIPMAEASDLIIDIGRWIFEQACRQASIWKDAGVLDFTIAINLSARQFRQTELLSMVRSTLRRHGLQAGRFEIELTESIIMTDSERSIETLERLREMGFQISVDDFGTGYSSIGYLKKLPVNKLKIDRSFITDLGTSAISDAIVKAVVSLAHGLNLSVVAEGVETTAQLDALRSFACDQYQGYLCSRPRPATDIPEIIQRQPRPSPRRSDEPVLEATG